MLVRLRQIPFWALTLCSGLIYLVFAVWFAFVPHHNVAPLADTFALARTWWQGLLYGVLLTILFGFYLLAWQRLREEDSSFTQIFLGTLLFIPSLILTFPINATDLYRYFIRGRVASIYGASPYAAAPTEFANDPYLPLAGEWESFTSPYGPLWELWANVVTAVVNRINPGQFELLTGLLTFKVVGSLAFLASGYFIFRIWALSDEDNARTRLLLWLWNPALLLTFVANGHNDSLMLFWFVLGWFLVKRGRPVLAWAAFILAMLTKPIGLLALPFLFIYLWRQRWQEGTAWRFLAITAPLSLILILLAFLPFGSPLDLAVRLVTESGSFPGFSLVTTIILIRNTLQGPSPFTDITTTSLLLFALATLYLIWLAWRERSPLRGAADIFYAYVLQASSFRIWYAAWPFPWLLLDQRSDSLAGSRLAAGILYLYLTQLSVIIYAHVRVFVFGGQHLWAHLLATPLVFLLPLIWIGWAGRGAAGED